VGELKHRWTFLEDSQAAAFEFKIDDGGHLGPQVSALYSTKGNFLEINIAGRIYDHNGVKTLKDADSLLFEAAIDFHRAANSFITYYFDTDTVMNEMSISLGRDVVLDWAKKEIEHVNGGKNTIHDTTGE
jgi:hypothetical protein